MFKRRTAFPHTFLGPLISALLNGWSLGPQKNDLLFLLLQLRGGRHFSSKRQHMEGCNSHVVKIWRILNTGILIIS